MDIRALMAYNHELWRRFADHFVDELSWDELSRNHETSHNTIANVTMHAINMEDWWLNYVLVGKAWEGPAWDGFRSAKEMRQRVRDVQKKTEQLLATASPADLQRKHAVEVAGEVRELTLEDVLVEVWNESTHHRGEVLAMMWRMDKEPPYVDYITWLTTRP